MFRYLSFLAFFIFTCKTASGEVRLPSFLSGGMVMQRDVAQKIWGWADPGEKVTVTFKEKDYRTKADEKGNWSVNIGIHNAGGPFELQVKGNNTIKLENILIGDVWICSGQSNMDWGLSGDQNAERAIAEAEFPNIRLFRVDKALAQQPQDVKGQWKVCSPETVGRFSAVGYYFGKEIHLSQDVPVGLIQASWGGSSIVSWMSAEAFKELPEYSGDISLLSSDQDYLKIKMEEFTEEQLNPWLKSISDNSTILSSSEKTDLDAVKNANWTKTRVPQVWEKTRLGDFDGLVWYKTTFNRGEPLKQDRQTFLSLGRLDDQDVVFLNGVRIGHGSWKEWSRYYEIPDSLLKNAVNELIIGIIDFGGEGGFSGDANDLFIESLDENGVLIRYPLSDDWAYFTEGYQPEVAPSWLGGINEPTMLYNAMLSSVTAFPVKGAIWYQGERSKSSPEGYDKKLKALIRNWRSQWGQEEMPFIFVQLPNYENEKGQYPDGNWAKLRHLQAQALALPFTGMAVTYDLGDPHDIHPLRKEPVGVRLALAARKVAYREELVSAGPEWKEVVAEENRIRIQYKNDDLIARDPYGYLRGFEIGFVNRQEIQLKSVQAEIVGDAIIIHLKELGTPDLIRYAWQDNPDANLYNAVGLPAPPFEYWFENKNQVHNDIKE